MTLPQIATLLLAERVKKVVVTSDDPIRTRSLTLPAGVEVRPRDEMMQIQQDLAATPGVTVLIHDQACAAEKRRKRKRGKADTPKQRVMINERICEGCGDCGEKSNCLSVHPVDTEFGRKTHIDQSSCNLDFSCLQGDCPSFVTVVPSDKERLRLTVADIDAAALPTPTIIKDIGDGFTLRVTGIGGTGVVTVSQIIATAAVLDGHVSRTVDMTGLAQKGGAVVSDVKVSAHAVEQAAKVASGDCDLYLSCDGLVGVDPANLKVASPDKTTAIVSTTKIPTGAMVIDTSVAYPSDADISSSINRSVRRGIYLDSGALTLDLFGDEQFANMLMVGAAYQSGAMPISAESIERAIALNGVAIQRNLQAFRRGRQIVADRAGVAAAINRSHPAPAPWQPSAQAVALTAPLASASAEVKRTVRRRIDELTDYQDLDYATEYVRFVERVARAEGQAVAQGLTDVVARNLFKLMAYKDEYEVARLTQDAAFSREVADQFGEDAAVAVRLHPPTLRALGMKTKIAIGRWGVPAMKSLAKAKRVRGTRLDPFGRAEVRQTERALIGEYRSLISEVLDAMADGTIGAPQRHAVVALAGLPDMVRGYEGIKMGNVGRYRAAVAEQRAALGI
jgi:indolepyruvate ferredoxin oxidoreductase